MITLLSALVLSPYWPNPTIPDPSYPNNYPVQIDPNGDGTRLNCTPSLDFCTPNTVDRGYPTG